MATDSASTDTRLHEAAVRLAVQCRRIVQACLREEEWLDADEEFYHIIRDGIRELLSATDGPEAGTAEGNCRERI